jgi:hypothetical protein
MYSFYKQIPEKILPMTIPIDAFGEGCALVQVNIIIKDRSLINGRGQGVDSPPIQAKQIETLPRHRVQKIVTLPEVSIKKK